MFIIFTQGYSTVYHLTKKLNKNTPKKKTILDRLQAASSEICSRKWKKEEVVLPLHLVLTEQH